MSVKKEISPDFAYSNIFPDANSIFKVRVQDVEEIKENCIVVLDTNTILVPYAVGAESLSQIEKVYRPLVDHGRLKVPGQVAREFAINRTTKLSELHSQLVRLKNVPSAKGKYPLLENDPAYAAFLEVEIQLEQVLHKYKQRLNDLINIVRAWSWDDPVSKLYSELFAEAIVDLRMSETDTALDLERRLALSIPPGYKDKGKELNSSGDLVIWQTILQIGEDENKDIIFVSGEGKTDWWYRSENHPLYPRFELVDEFWRKTGGKSFHILRLSALLELFGVGEDTVTEVEAKEKQYEIEERVSSWQATEVPQEVLQERLLKDYLTSTLRERLPVSYIFGEGTTFPHILFGRLFSGEIYEVGIAYLYVPESIVLNQPTDLRNSINALLSDSFFYLNPDLRPSNSTQHKERSNTVSRTLTVYIASGTNNGAKSLARYILNTFTLPNHLPVAIGFINLDGTFTQVADLLSDH